MKKVLPPSTLVLGGAASGKSSFAEKLVKDTGKPRTYLATAQAFDAEMDAKINRHKKMRGSRWTTVEVPLDVVTALAEIDRENVILLDCATLWLSNQLMADRDIEAEQATLMDALTACKAQLVIVSNEVGQGIVPDNALARRFREAQGRLNIGLAAHADLVIQVVAGLPRVLKGQMP